MTKFEKKVKIFCALHGNLVRNLPKKWAWGESPRIFFSSNPPIESDTCVKCRAKNNGICNVQHFTYQIIYNKKSEQILEINFKRSLITYRMDYGMMYLDEKEYYTATTSSDTICFGFLSIDGD